MWIHDGFPGNPLYDLATALGLPLTQAQDYFSTTVFQPDGGLANETSFREVYTAWLDVLAQIDALRAAADDPATAGVGADMSAASLLDAQLAAHPEWTAEQMRQANTIFNTQLQVLLNANATDLSALRSVASQLSAWTQTAAENTWSLRFEFASFVVSIHQVRRRQDAPRHRRAVQGRL